MTNIEVKGAELLQAAVADGNGVLITPNHASHADPYVLLDVADHLQQSFFFMVAWHVFAQKGPLGRFVLRSHGSFSVNREGTDWTALLQAIEILRSNSCPLVIFPEGDIFHLNDRIRPFHGGCGTIAQFAARRARRPVLCFPCGIRYRYVEDPTPELLALADKLENQVGRRPRPDLPLVERARRMTRGLLRHKELEYFGRTLDGSLSSRKHGLSEFILTSLERLNGIRKLQPSVSARVQVLRQQIVKQLRSCVSNADQADASRKLADLNLVVQLFSYPADYLDGCPSIERIVETWDRLEEDVLGVTTATARGVRTATVTFGVPIAAQPHRSPRLAARDLTRRLEYAVRQMVEPAERALKPLEHPRLYHSSTSI